MDGLPSVLSYRLIMFGMKVFSANKTGKICLRHVWKCILISREIKVFLKQYLKPVHQNLFLRKSFMFFRKKKFSVQGQLLLRLLKENDDWAVLKQHNIQMIHSFKHGITLYSHCYDSAGNLISYRIFISPKQGDGYVADAFNKYENSVLNKEIEKIIEEHRNKTLITSLKKAVNSLPIKSES